MIVPVEVLIIAVIGAFCVDTPVKNALNGIVNFCKLIPTQNLPGTL